MYLDWEPAQQKDYDELLAAVRAAFGALPAAPAGPFERDTWLRCGALGLLGLCLPVETGGGGLGALDTAHLVEAFGRGCPDTGLVFSAAAHLFACGVPVAAFASAPTRRRLLPGLCSGRLVAANAMTERDAGSDLSGLATRAVRNGGDWVLSGEKSWASNAPAADVIVTYAVTDPEAGFFGTTAFVLDRETPGVVVDGPFAKMGLASCPAGAVRFEDCRVPAGGVLGEVGQGGMVFQHSMGWERACLFAGYVGLMDRLLDRCVEHVRSRRQFGRRLADFQAVSHRLAEMKVRLEAARLLLYRACFRMDAGRADIGDAALSKLAVSEAAVRAGIDAIQLLGAPGYLAAEGVEAALRDAVPATLFSGTSEIQREMIARGLGL
jgi:alkylation response protein AidB-like acyl-CoA dehydrogenase